MTLIAIIYHKFWYLLSFKLHIMFFFFFPDLFRKNTKSYLMSCFACLFAIIYCSMKMKTATKSYLHLTVTLQQQWTMPGLLVGRYDHFFHGLSCEELTLACANHMLCPCIVHVRPMIVWSMPWAVSKNLSFLIILATETTSHPFIDGIYVVFKVFWILQWDPIFGVRILIHGFFKSAP